MVRSGLRPTTLPSSTSTYTDSTYHGELHAVHYTLNPLEIYRKRARAKNVKSALRPAPPRRVYRKQTRRLITYGRPCLLCGHSGISYREALQSLQAIHGRLKEYEVGQEWVSYVSNALVCRDHYTILAASAYQLQAMLAKIAFCFDKPEVRNNSHIRMSDFLVHLYPFCVCLSIAVGGVRLRRVSTAADLRNVEELARLFTYRMKTEPWPMSSNNLAFARSERGAGGRYGERARLHTNMTSGSYPARAPPLVAALPHGDESPRISARVRSIFKAAWRPVRPSEAMLGRIPYRARHAQTPAHGTGQFSLYMYHRWSEDAQPDHNPIRDRSAPERARLPNVCHGIIIPIYSILTTGGRPA
ncbi:hypothetical protein EVAR_69862_1 [Eumeta japonica]|uniref:Uncharacterized protein n=1 Tax=Eumeta variegata TaxID=151549 RepID=A0A4C2AHQ8_EUMVA|nr:hypothetical protein EVAR_69862_1 [Eumeta japonica]